MWQAFKAERKFTSAVLSRIVDDHIPEGIQAYLLELDIPRGEAHDEFDESQGFLAFLEKVKPMQPEEPTVWIGKPIFRV